MSSAVRTAAGGRRQRHLELGERAAAPAHGQRRAALLSDWVEDHLLDQGSQQLLAVAVGGGGGRPDPSEVCAEREQSLALLWSEDAGAPALAQLQLGLCGGERRELLLPLALQAAGHEAVLGLDRR